mgnify:CR=1 FL=1
MTDNYLKGELAALAESVEKQLRGVADLQQRRAKLTGRGTAAKQRVVVVVNADGVVVDTKFTGDVEELTYGELAKAVTEAAQAAAEDVGRKWRDLSAPMLAERAKMPSLGDLVSGLPDVRVPAPPPASTAPPEHEGGMEFTDVEEFDHRRSSGTSVNDSGW